MKFTSNQTLNNIIKGVLVVFIYFLFQDILAEPITKLTINILGEQFIRDNAILVVVGLNLLITSIQLILICIVLFDDIKNVIRGFKPNSQYFKAVLVGFGLYYLTNYIVNIVTNIYNPNLGETTNQQNIETMLFSSTGTFIFTSLLIVVLGPIVEELVFRKAFFMAIPNKWAALVASSFVFGIIHVLSTDCNLTDGFFYTLPYLASGAVLGYTYIKNDRNITVTIGLHMFMNFISLILMLLLSM